MTITRHHLIRSAALAGVLLATAGTAAASASPLLARVDGRITYLSDPVAATDDVVTFQSGFVGGDYVTTITSNQTMTRTASAAAWCAPASGRAIECATGTEESVVAHAGPGDDRITLLVGNGAGLRLTAFGGDGNDALTGADRADTLDGGAGADRLDGGAASDLAAGGEGDDTLVGDRGSDRLDGGDGHDVADYGGRPDDLGVVLSNSGAYTAGGPLDDAVRGALVPRRDALIAIEEVRGGDGDDQLMGTYRVVLRGGPGDDLLHGAGGPDVLHGEDGDDILVGSGGLDEVYGGDGDDDLRMDDAAVDVAIDCGPGVDRRVGDPGDGAIACEDVVVLDPSRPSPTPPEETAPPVATEPVPAAPITAPAPAPAPAPPAPPARPRRVAPALGVGIAARFAPGRRSTAVTRLRVTRIPAGATVVLACRATRSSACPFRRTATRYRRATHRADLLAALRGRRLGAGAVLELRVTRPGFRPTVRRYTVRAGSPPARG